MKKWKNKDKSVLKQKYYLKKTFNGYNNPNNRFWPDGKKIQINYDNSS